MSVPKSVIKFDKNGVKYVSSVDYCKHSIQELTRAALRDVGKLLARYANNEANAKLHVKARGKLSPFQYWVRKKETDLHVGVERPGHKAEWYGVAQELGTSNMPKMSILTNTARENIAEIVRIESQYLTALQADAEALFASEDDMEGGADD